MFSCSEMSVGEDEVGEEGEAGNAVVLSRQSDIANRCRRQLKCYKET